MKKVALSILLILFNVCLFAQSEPTDYASTIQKFKLFYNSNKPDSIYKMFGAEMRNALSADQFKATTSQIKIQLGSLKQTQFKSFAAPVASYNAVFDNGALTLKLSLNSSHQIIGLLLQPAEVKAEASSLPSDPSVTETPITQKTLSGNISGTLTMPKNASGKIPVVLIIAGSGPTDRDGNSPKLGLNANIYKLMAVDLAKNGIASLRYDKRLVGQSVSSTKEKELRFGDYVDDAIALINLLHNDTRFSKIIVLGHSEGSLVGMLASDDEPVSGFISVAGAGERADILLTNQMKSQPQYIADGFRSILDSLKRGKLTDRVDPALYPIARPDVQPYLLSWMMHDPARDIKKLKIPVLIIQGTTDLQVSVSNAEKLKKANSDATLSIIPNMNHILKEAPADKDKNLETYHKPDLPLKPELVTDIVGFINKLK